MRTSSRLMLLMKRFCRSAAVKKTFVRLVSTRTTSSELIVTSSSFFGGVGVACGTSSVRRGRLAFGDSDPLCANDAQVKATEIVATISSTLKPLHLLCSDTLAPIILLSRYPTPPCIHAWSAVSCCHVRKIV